MLESFQSHRNLILQALLSISLSLILTFLKIPVLFLHGIHTYVQPENLGQKNNPQGVRAAIRRPSSTNSGSGLEGYRNLSSKSNVELRRRSKSKEKFDFDESNAQIFRIKLDEGHLQTRLYFNEYRNCFVLSFMAFSCFLLHKYIGESEYGGFLANGGLVPVVFGFAALCKALVSLARVWFERSASRKSERTVSLVTAGLGFVVGMVICAGIIPNGFDFKFGSIDGSWSVLISLLMACIAGFLYVPSGRSARSFWLGTDQIKCNLSIISSGWFGRTILYANYIVNIFTALLWINPFAEILINTNLSGGSGSASLLAHNKRLVGNVGISPSVFLKFKSCCLLLSGLLQILALRPNLQMFLNEAVLSWYQRLHASKSSDLDYSRAKIFLHNHYLCLVAVQFFAPPLLILLFLGLSQMDSALFRRGASLSASGLCPDPVKDFATLMAWWVVFVWSVFTSSSLFFYRRGVLYVS